MSSIGLIGMFTLVGECSCAGRPVVSMSLAPCLDLPRVQFEMGEFLLFAQVHDLVHRLVIGVLVGAKDYGGVVLAVLGMAERIDIALFKPIAQFRGFHFVL